jgi:heme o synthase
MSHAAPLNTDTVPGFSRGEVEDYIALLKPRVMSLVVFTALVGMVVAHPAVHPVIAAASLIMIAVGAGASGCLNMWWDADVDALMTRTGRRPIPAGRISRDEALSFGLVLAVGAVLALGLIANWLAAALLAFTIFFYSVVYSMWLKRATAQNIVIGGAAGAVPPLVAWAATTGSLNGTALYLFAIVFFWTPPHFWALSLLMKDEYARAGVPMLPVVRGEGETRRQILLYAVLLYAVSQLPFCAGAFGVTYLVCSVVLGAAFIAGAYRLLRRADRRTALRLYLFSLAYLALLFGAMVADARL